MLPAASCSVPRETFILFTSSMDVCLAASAFLSGASRGSRAAMSSTTCLSCESTSCLNHWLPVSMRENVRPLSVIVRFSCVCQLSSGVSEPSLTQKWCACFSPFSLNIGSPCTLITLGGDAGGDGGGDDGGLEGEGLNGGGDRGGGIR